MALTTNSTKTYTTQYNNFGGVDFSSGAENVYKKHSPTSVNMISDLGGNPKKRRGWERIINGCKCVNLWSFAYYEEEHLIAQIKDGDNYYLVRIVDDEFESTRFKCGEKVIGFYTATDNDSIFNVITDGKMYEYLYKNNAFAFREVTPYVPLYSVGGSPNRGGGTTLEGLNLLTKKVRERYLGNTSYSTSDTGVRTYAKDNRVWLTYVPDITQEIKITYNWRSINKSTKNAYTFGAMADGTGSNVHTELTYHPSTQKWTFITDTSKYEDGSLVSTRTSGTTASSTYIDTDNNSIIHLNPRTYYPLVDGEDNIEVEYTILDSNNNLGRSMNAFLSCNNTALYENRVWFTGATGDYGNRVWYSALMGGFTSPLYGTASYDFTSDAYYPETNYIVVGSNDTRVLGLTNLGEYLGAIKEASAVETTVYLIYSTSFDSDTAYACKNHVSGAGAIGVGTFCNMDNETLFLGADGIHGLNSQTIKNRSYYVNKQLVNEPNLENAIAVVFNGYYILCVNDNCYVLDSRQKLSWRTEWTNYLYACYYWENIPAKGFAVYQGELYFRHKDGSLCRFRDPSDSHCYRDDVDTPIECEWSTPLDNDGATQLYKTLQKKGTVATLYPYAHTSVDMYINADSRKLTFVGTQFVDSVDFSDIRFDRFGLSSNYSPVDCFFKKKDKKYKRLQFVLRNNALDEPFMIEEITKTYTVQGYSKRRSGDGVFKKETY